MVSQNIVKKIPIAIGIKPNQPTTFTNKTIDCGPGNGNVISNLPNTALQNSSLTINGVTISLGDSAVIDNSGGSISFVKSITAGNGITVSQTTGDVVISASQQSLDNVLTEGNSTTQDIVTTGKILYSNIYNNVIDLPNASTYHGMFAHVHATGKGYFAHGGNWIPLLDSTSTIDDLSNVNTVGVSTGAVLKYDGTSWVAGVDNAGAGGGGIALTDLSVTSNPAFGNGSLLYNSTSGVFTFTPADTSPTNLDGLTDVAITTPSTGEVLKYNGTSWVNDVDATGGASYGDSDVDTHLNTGSASSGEILSWNGTDYAWVTDQTGSGGSSNAITQGDTAVTITDTGTDGRIVFKTDNTDRWRISRFGHILPSTNADYDIGSAEYKVRHLFLSDNSLKFVDANDTEFALGVTNGELTFNGSPVGSGSGGSLASRSTRSGDTSASHANNAAENVTITGYKGYALYKVTVSEPAWVSLYVSSASRTADASRDITEDPTPGSGVIAEVITQSSNETVLFTPAVIGYNDDSTPSANVYLKVVNRSGSTQSINVELTVTQLEA